MAANRKPDQLRTARSETAAGPLPSGRTPRPPSRQGKKPVTAFVEKDVHKQLRRLGIELEKSTQEMIVEALDNYFELHSLRKTDKG